MFLSITFYNKNNTGQNGGGGGGGELGNESTLLNKKLMLKKMSKYQIDPRKLNLYLTTQNYYLNLFVLNCIFHVT